MQSLYSNQGDLKSPCSNQYQEMGASCDLNLYPGVMYHSQGFNDTSFQGKSAKETLLHQCLKHLETYFYLICFNAYIHDQVSTYQDALCPAA